MQADKYKTITAIEKLTELTDGQDDIIFQDMWRMDKQDLIPIFFERMTLEDKKEWLIGMEQIRLMKEEECA